MTISVYTEDEVEEEEEEEEEDEPWRERLKNQRRVVLACAFFCIFLLRGEWLSKCRRCPPRRSPGPSSGPCARPRRALG